MKTDLHPNAHDLVFREYFPHEGHIQFLANLHFLVLVGAQVLSLCHFMFVKLLLEWYCRATEAIQRLRLVNQELQEVSHDIFVLYDQINVPFVLDTERYAVPGVKGRIRPHCLLRHQYCLFAQHPEAGEKWSVKKADHIVQPEAG